MDSRLLDLYRAVNAAHRDLVQKCVLLERHVTECGDLEELSDAAYVLREAYKHADESRKELKRLDERVAMLFCVLWANDPNSPETVRTKWCTCTPDPKQRVLVPTPNKDPERYRAVLEWLGVPEEQIASGVLRVGWEEFGEWVTAKMRNGDPLPEILASKKYTEYRLGVRCRTQLPTGASGGPDNDVIPGEGENDDGESRVQSDDSSGDDPAGVNAATDEVPF